MYTCLCVCACMYTHTHAHSVKHKITCVKSDIPCVYLQPSYSPVYSVKINLIKCMCVCGNKQDYCIYYNNSFATYIREANYFKDNKTEFLFIGFCQFNTTGRKIA